MRAKRIVSGLVVVGAMLSSSIASARVSVFVHGRNQGPADVVDYWHVGGSGDGVYAFSGNNAESHYTYSYDASVAWSDLSNNNTPVCQLTNAMYNAPGTDMATVTHSAGGLVAAYALAVAQNGWENSCAHSPASARSWMTYFVPVAAPFRGSELADRVYGHTAGNFLQKICGGVAGALSNLMFNQSNAMTWALQTSMVQQNYGNLTAYGSYSAIYQNWGTTTSGDDQFAMDAATTCGFMPGAHDGVVAEYSASYAIPGGHKGWHDAVGHSSNRRNDYRSFATNVWNSNPY